MAETKDPKNTIAFQGAPGAHSDVACRSAYPYMYTLPCATFEDVFDAVEEGKAAMALIPIENSRAGRVAEIHNLLPNTNLSIIGEYIHRVRHHLLGTKEATLETVKNVYSHNQALMQCRDHLRKMKLTPVPFGDTAAAAEKIGKDGDPTRAALASDLAAELYGLKVLKENMQDHDDNSTLFLALSKEPADPKPDQLCITSILFTTRNIPAGLYKALGGFATNGINMLKLESYIQGFDSSTAQFFMSFIGHPEEKGVRLALEELGFFTNKVKILGVYPADKNRRLST